MFRILHAFAGEGVGDDFSNIRKKVGACAATMNDTDLQGQNDEAVSDFRKSYRY